MNTADYEKLMQPAVSEPPCGPDNSFTPEFMELETLIRGKEETQFSEAVKPDWKQVRDSVLEQLEQSKHLQLATTLCVAQLELEGLEGAADSIEFLSSFVATFWDEMHPKLDPSDNLDPLERVNILTALCTPLGTFGDPYKFLERLASAPLTDSPVLGKVSYRMINHNDFPADADVSSMERAQIEAAFRDTPTERLQTFDLCLSRISAAVTSLRTSLEGFCKDAPLPDFDPLLNLTKGLKKELADYLPEEVPTAEEESTESGTPAQPRTKADITSRDDVTLALDRINEYYRKFEPSSPIPLLLQRAKRLVHLDFLQIVQDLAPDSLTQVHTATGTKPSEE